MKAAKTACKISVEIDGSSAVPISTPTKMPTAQVRKNAKSKLPSESCLRVDATALGRTSAIEVPTATCINWVRHPKQRQQVDENRNSYDAAPDAEQARC